MCSVQIDSAFFKTCLRCKKICVLINCVLSAIDLKVNSQIKLLYDENCQGENGHNVIKHLFFHSHDTSLTNEYPAALMSWAIFIFVITKKNHTHITEKGICSPNELSVKLCSHQASVSLPASVVRIHMILLFTSSVKSGKCPNSFSICLQVLDWSTWLDFLQTKPVLVFQDF